MGEKFEFEIQESLDTINKILGIAEKYESQSDFDGLLAKNLLALHSIINDSSFVNRLNTQLITCRNYRGLKLMRAWDGGFASFRALLHKALKDRAFLSCSNLSDNLGMRSA
ncbi:hypothetical protein [Acinetobacter sp. WCHA55]|uniref:hypothetical protein n=1 Tax=Acinetobacter sp. WCHA55 TaxID=2004646 RepID=UPI001D196CCE|nr:hypothetical protein [Acinetobacter sp. WCHA55]